jgi:hypothetical protein
MCICARAAGQGAIAMFLLLERFTHNFLGRISASRVTNTRSRCLFRAYIVCTSVDDVSKDSSVCIKLTVSNINAVLEKNFQKV